MLGDVVQSIGEGKHTNHVFESPFFVLLVIFGFWYNELQKSFLSFHRSGRALYLL